jgi:predicted membrane channel-forming protein YqfA (hemolysin III family)
MKSVNSDIIRSIFFLLGVVFFLILLICIPNWIMMIPNNTVRLAVLLLITGLILFYTIFDIVHTVRKKKYSTTVFIVIFNILIALSFIAFTALLFIHVNPNELDKLVLFSKLGTGFSITCAVSIALQQFCRRDKYLRKAEQKPVE